MNGRFKKPLIFYFALALDAQLKKNMHIAGYIKWTQLVTECWSGGTRALPRRVQSAALRPEDSPWRLWKAAEGPSGLRNPRRHAQPGHFGRPSSCEHVQPRPNKVNVTYFLTILKPVHCSLFISWRPWGISLSSFVRIHTQNSIFISNFIPQTFWGRTWTDDDDHIHMFSQKKHSAYLYGMSAIAVTFRLIVARRGLAARNPPLGHSQSRQSRR